MSLVSVLPRLDCRQCGYSGCQSYADAIVGGEASIDRCPPGGITVLTALAAMTQQSVEDYIPDVQQRSTTPQSAHIDKACVACFKCAEICPVDAIIGAPGTMHQLLAAECNGCGLCIPVCPVDCIELHDSDESFQLRYSLRDYYQQRQQDKKIRVENQEQQKYQHYLKWRGVGKAGKQLRKNYIEQAQQRVSDAKQNKNS